MEPYTVYVMTDEQRRITDITSSALLKSMQGWMAIDSGYGDAFHHAQDNYLHMPLRNLPLQVGGRRASSANCQEMDADYTPLEVKSTQLDRIEAQALYTALMTDTLIEEA